MYFCDFDFKSMKKIILFLLLPALAFSQDKLSEITLLINQKAYKKAEVQSINYLKTHPNNLVAIELLGDALGYQKKWDSATVQYKKLVDTKPEIANYQYKYGGVLGMKALQNKFKAIGLIGDIKEAFTKAAELDKTHIDARWALVELYMQLPGIFGGSKSKSLQYAQELENLSKVDGYLAKGYVYEYDDEPELAEKYYKMAIQEGGSLTCFNKLTHFYENEKQPKKAIENLEETHKKHHRNALHYQIGKVAAEYKIQLDKGEQCLQTYLKNYSAQDGIPIAWAHYRLAQIHAHQKDKEKALKHINIAIAELPKIKPFLAQKSKILNL